MNARARARFIRARAQARCLEAKIVPILGPSQHAGTLARARKAKIGTVAAYAPARARR